MSCHVVSYLQSIFNPRLKCPQQTQFAPIQCPSTAAVAVVVRTLLDGGGGGVSG